MTKTRTTLTGLLSTTLALSGVSYAEATGYPYEQTVCWAMDNPTFDNALITTTHKYVDGEWQQTSSSTINGAARCATKPNELPVKEEGL